MELAIVGLGRMGGNMARRLHNAGHRVVAYNRSFEKTQEIMGEGLEGGREPEDVVTMLGTPKVVWLMVPAGDATEQTMDEFAALLSPGDTIVDGGNSNFHDSKRRHALMKERGAIACPTLVTYEALKNEGASLGLPATSVAKIDDVRLRGIESLDIMRRAGVTMAYGTDLLGEMHRHQSEEFVIRGRVLPAAEVIRSATADAAELVGMTGQIGTVAPGAYADLIVVDGDPLKDLSLLTKQGGHMPLIMKDGQFIKNELNQ